MRFAYLLMLPLVGCATAEAAPPVAGEPAATCRREALAAFTGQVASADLAARMLAASGARDIRWVPEGTMVTMEFRADRVTAHLDQTNRVIRASCS